LARLDESGRCAACRRQPTPERRESLLQNSKQRMEELFDEIRERPGLHVTVAASGGKDSSYTLLRLKEHHRLRVQAVAVDNGFLSAHAEQNLLVVTDALEIPLVIVRPPVDRSRAVFAMAAREEPFSPLALQRASGICNACIGMVKSICLQQAIEWRTPLLAWGWSPGQAPLASAIHRPSPALLRSFMGMLQGPLADALGDSARDLFPTESQLADVDGIPTSINPLAVEPYDEVAIRERLEGLGWYKPADTDANSTNCRLNALGNHLHRARHGTNPYAVELAGLVREGWMDAAEAAARLAQLEDPQQVRAVACDLGVEDLLDEE
jgi:hypothetical protein